MLCRLFFLFCVFLVLSRLVVENGKYPTAYHIFPVNATFSSLIMAFTGSKRGIWVGDMTLTDFTLHFSCCFTKLLHSHFMSLLNPFTKQEKCC